MPRLRGRAGPADLAPRPAWLFRPRDLHQRGCSERGALRGLIRNGPAGDYTTFRRVGYEGVTTFNTRSDYTHTVTLPNHTTAFTGRPVLQPTGQSNTVHHFYTNQ